MSEDRDPQDEKEEPAATARSDWKHLASTGTLLAAVLAILAAGAALQAERSSAAPVRPPGPVPSTTRPAPPPPAPSPRIEERETPPAAAAPARPVTAPPPAASAGREPPPAGNDLVRRASKDLERLSRERESFTAQVAVVCKPENTRRILEKAAGANRLFLVPMPERGATCYRLCWGLYPSAKEAAQAPDLPAFLGAAGGRPAAKSVAEIAP